MCFWHVDHESNEWSERITKKLQYGFVVVRYFEDKKSGDCGIKGPGKGEGSAREGGGSKRGRNKGLFSMKTLPR